MVVQDLTAAVGEFADSAVADPDELLQRSCEVAAGSIAQMRWLAFEQVAAEIGVHAGLAVPLISRGHIFGTLDHYWRREHDPDVQDRAWAQLLAHIAVSYLVMAHSRAQSRAAQHVLAYRALHRQLTGLPGRELIQQLIKHALAAAVRRGTAVAVLVVDVDHFKSVTDRCGHHTGDEVLQILARRMQRTLRAGDSVGRISGDEFLILCEDPRGDGVVSAELLTGVGERWRAAVAEPVTVPTFGQPISITVSIGIARTGRRYRDHAP